MDQHLADVDFVDGIRRPVSETPTGRQYVVDDDGQRLYGVWFLPSDVAEPIIVLGDRGGPAGRKG